MALSREQKVAKARELRAQNVTCREIGERLGLGKDEVWQWTWDVEIPRACPGCGADLTRTHARRKWCSETCRKATLYGGTCEGCGASTNGSNGAEAAARRCLNCTRKRNAERNNLLGEMWEAGEPTWFIAEKLGMTETAVTAWVDTQRRKHGEDLQLRRLGGGTEERRKRHRRMIQLRRRGMSNAEIAEAVGMTGAASVSTAFVGMRQKGWKVPPSPRVTAPRAGRSGATASEISRLRQQGLSNAEISAQLGYANSGTLKNRIYELRQQGYFIVPAKRGRPPKAIAA